MTDRFIRKAELEAKVGLCERQIRTLEGEGLFPARIPITPNGRAVAWSEAEVDAWLAERRAARGTERAFKPGQFRPGQGAA